MGFNDSAQFNVCLPFIEKFKFFVNPIAELIIQCFNLKRTSQLCIRFSTTVAES